ncbi:MAG: reverse transcriptase family protein, partial [Polyangiales bacterium]
MHPVVVGLAHAFLVESPQRWTLRALRQRGAAALGKRPPWLMSLSKRVYEHFAQAPSELVPMLALLARDEGLREALAQAKTQPTGLRVRRWYLEPDRMGEVDGPPAGFDVLPLATEGELAAHLGVGSHQLPWFADPHRINAARSSQRLRHYRYRWVKKPSGGMRLLETPKPRLKAIQRFLLSEILSHCPVDSAAHGFVPGRSVLSFAAAHVGQPVVLRLDLEDFFLSIRQARVTAIFRRLGYPWPVARNLSGLCCTPTPDAVITAARPALDFHSATRMRSAHLAQGAPTSPALSNLASLRLDRRLRGLARAAGANYSRYAD